MSNTDSEKLTFQWVNTNESLPVGVTSFKTMSDWVAVKYFSKYAQKEITVCGRYCHDRHEWFVSGGCDDDANKKEVIKWLHETIASDLEKREAPSDELLKYNEARVYLIANGIDPDKVVNDMMNGMLRDLNEKLTSALASRDYYKELAEAAEKVLLALGIDTNLPIESNHNGPYEKVHNEYYKLKQSK